MKYLSLLLLPLVLGSCWGYIRDPYEPQLPTTKVWGSKPVYASKPDAAQIRYLAGRQPLQQAGNIYAFGHYIFQVDVGRGIHVIDNSDPAKADRIGYIVVNGCAQLSIKGNYLYTNSLADLVTIDISDPVQVREVARVANAFPEMAYSYPLVQPEEKGYYQCPRYDSVVVGWVKDSIYASCMKQ